MPHVHALDGFAVEEQVGHLLRRANQRHVALFQDSIQRSLGAEDLTPPQFAALAALVTRGHVTQNQLGRLVAMDPATVQGVVRRLVTRGLVARDRDPADRRTAVLVPTEAGRSLAARAVPCARRITEATLAPLDAAERRVFLSLLRRLV
jgi:DNA-binding MarR family transcriptional regulator